MHATWFHFAGLFPDKPGPVCPDLEVWTEVDPASEDEAFLVEQVDQL